VRWSLRVSNFWVPGEFLLDPVDDSHCLPLRNDAPIRSGPHLGYRFRIAPNSFWTERSSTNAGLLSARSDYRDCSSLFQGSFNGKVLDRFCECPSEKSGVRSTVPAGRTTIACARRAHTG
jgi:hypothetical protein